MSNYFEPFTKVDYDINNDGKPLKLTDITLRYRFKKAMIKNKFDFYTYTVQDGERIDTIAHKYYGSSKYAWLLLLLNDIIDPHYGWVMSQEVFNIYIQNKYGSMATANSTVHHYEQIGILKAGVLLKYPKPIIISESVYDLIKDSIKDSKSDLNENVAKSVSVLDHENVVKSVSVLDHENELNEAKRHIKLLDRTQLREVLELVNSVFE